MPTPSALDADRIRRLTHGYAQQALSQVEVFAEIDSTNSYLMQMPSPSAGKMNVAATTNQVAGRGRHGKTWQAPAGSCLAISSAYTFAKEPDNLPALTLAIGLSCIAALDELGYRNIQIKWPNDLVANNGKLGGILTEVQQRNAEGVTVVTGLGVNLDMPASTAEGIANGRTLSVADLKSIGEALPAVDSIAAMLLSAMYLAFHEFENHGLAKFRERWQAFDWLHGRQLTADSEAGRINGIGAGIAEDGALLIETEKFGLQRVTTGSILL